MNGTQPATNAPQLLQITSEQVVSHQRALANANRINAISIVSFIPILFCSALGIAGIMNSSLALALTLTISSIALSILNFLSTFDVPPALQPIPFIPPQMPTPGPNVTSEPAQMPTPNPNVTSIPPKMPISDPNVVSGPPNLGAGGGGQAHRSMQSQHALNVKNDISEKTMDVSF